jgi:transmembrane sensor
VRACPSADVPHPVSPHPIPISESAALAAIDWFVEFQSGKMSAAMRDDWQAWRDASADNERAWQRIQSVRGTFETASAPIKSTIAHAALTARGSARRKQAVKALSVLFVVGVTGWSVQRQTFWQAWHADVHTEIGQQKTLTLDDGTQLVLNTDTAVNVYFNGQERRIALIKGEILITTAQDNYITTRPFLVDTPHGRMQALGTVFSVREQDDETRLAVFDGAVQVWPAHMSGQSVVVRAGEQIGFTTNNMTQLSRADDASIAWKDNMLVVKDMRLDDFLQALGRYTDAGLSCDTNVATLRVSGSYPLQDISTIVDTVSAMLGLHVQTVTRFWGGTAIRFGQPIKQIGRVA